VTLVGMLCCVLFTYTVYFLKNNSKLNYKIWDLDTCTTADYTVFVTFTQSAWKTWKINSEKVSNENQTHGQKSFKNFVANEMIE